MAAGWQDGSVDDRDGPLVTAWLADGVNEVRAERIDDRFATQNVALREVTIRTRWK